MNKISSAMNKIFLNIQFRDPQKIYEMNIQSMHEISDVFTAKIKTNLRIRTCILRPVLNNQCCKINRAPIEV